MPRMRRLVRYASLLAVTGAVGLGLGGCDWPVQGSLVTNQPQGIGPVHIRFELCTFDINEFLISEGSVECSPRKEDGQAQDFLALALPPGSTPPETITAVPSPETGGTPIVYTRSQKVAEKAAEVEPEQTEPWYPPGSVMVGYISQVFDEKKGENLRWSVEIDVELPPAAPYADTFSPGVFLGWRRISAEKPESRPFKCNDEEFESKEIGPEETEFIVYEACGPIGSDSIGVSDLEVLPPKGVTNAYVGGTASVPFELALGSTAEPVPTFSLKGSTNLAGASAAATNGVFQPGAIDATTHLAPVASRKVSVKVPAKAKPGVYDVVLTASTPAGGSTAGLARLRVTKPKIKVFKAKVKPNGTAVLPVKVPGAGVLTAKGKGLAKAKRRTKRAGKVSLKLKAKGAAKAELLASGATKLKFVVAFKPNSGSPVSLSRSVKLKLAR